MVVWLLYRRFTMGDVLLGDGSNHIDETIKKIVVVEAAVVVVVVAELMVVIEVATVMVVIVVGVIVLQTV